MIIIAIPLLVAILGALMYALASNPKLQEMGRILFFCGVLVALMAIGTAKVHLG